MACTEVFKLCSGCAVLCRGDSGMQEVSGPAPASFPISTTAALLFSAHRLGSVFHLGENEQTTIKRIPRF